MFSVFYRHEPKNVFMRIVPLVVFLVVSFVSCNENNSETNHLRDKVAILEQKVDSLERVIKLNNPSRLKPESKKKVAKKSNTNNAEPEIVTLKAPDKEAVQPEKTEYNSSLNSKSNTSSSPSNNSSATTQQCMGTTKKGGRCKRMVTNANYCWQHGG